MPPMASPPTIHWIVPFAASLSEPCQHALTQWARHASCPNLETLLSQLSIQARLEGEEFDLLMPHEKLLGRHWGWPDDQAPWALWWAKQDGLSLDTHRPWGLLSPCHWLMGRDHLTLLDPQALNLTEAESKQLLEAIRPLFESEGWTIVWGHPLRWYVSHPSLADLPAASLDRVIGRNPDLWLTDHPQARLLRRLQSEVQMTLYQHPAYDERQARGELAVNSFWLSGCGALPEKAQLSSETQDLQLVTTLRHAMLSDDMVAWMEAWNKLDATVLKEIAQRMQDGQTVALTLCGDRHAVTWSNAQRPSPLQQALRTIRAWVSRPTLLAPTALQDL